MQVAVMKMTRNPMRMHSSGQLHDEQGFPQREEGLQESVLKIEKVLEALV